MKRRLEEELEFHQEKSHQEKYDEMLGIHNMMKESKQRKWLIKRGKGHVLAFTDDEIRKLKECFSQLDDDGSGSIGIEELEEPLIGLGLADTKHEVKQMIEAVDDDGSGQIEFEEFIGIIQQSQEGQRGSKINQFFKDMSNGKLGDQNLSFSVNVQDLRRKLMMAAILGHGQEQDEGRRILNNVNKQIHEPLRKAGVSSPKAIFDL